MPWGQTEKDSWFQKQKIQRSYRDDVVCKIQALYQHFNVERYGALSINPELYPLYIIKSKAWAPKQKTILVTGGVHGYETSGVQGALGFMAREAPKYEDTFNFVCTPCISPWAYETINRWDPKAIDPNRNFVPESPAEECRLFLAAMATHKVEPFAHFDLHETTDTDNSIFRPALEQRDGVTQELSEIPDGFYVVGDTENPQPEFQRAIIAAVRRVTHIAPPDAEGRLIGEKIEQEGVINYELKKLGLCTGFSNAEYTTTTEVYPDSPKATPAICIEAQIAAITGGLDFLKH